MKYKKTLFFLLFIGFNCGLFCFRSKWAEYQRRKRYLLDKYKINLDQLSIIGVSDSTTVSLAEIEIYNAKLKNTKSLTLNGGIPEGIPPAINHLHQLEELILIHCSLKNLDGLDFDKLSNLKSLDLHDNNFRSFPEGIYKLKKLRRLDLTYLDELDVAAIDFSQFPELEYLSIGSIECLKKVPLSINALHNLQELDLSWNNITNIDEIDFRNFPRLQKIDLYETTNAKVIAERVRREIPYVRTIYTKE